MKTIIAGGRDYFFNANDIDKLNELKDQISEVVSGKARGADTCGEDWAKQNNIPIKEFPADWFGLGKKAGFVRNTQMAKYAEACILFPGGKGTEHMFNLAKKYSLIVYDFR